MPTAEDTKACSDKLRKGATANGLTLADWDKYTAGAKLLPTTVSSAKGQPEGRESWWDYIAKTVDDERVADGKMMMKKVGSQLNTIGQQYQVDPATLVAIFGIETNYGRQIGKTNVLNAGSRAPAPRTSRCGKRTLTPRCACCATAWCPPTTSSAPGAAPSA